MKFGTHTFLPCGEHKSVIKI